MHEPGFELTVSRLCYCSQHHEDEDVGDRGRTLVPFILATLSYATLRLKRRKKLNFPGMTQTRDFQIGRQRHLAMPAPVVSIAIFGLATCIKLEWLVTDLGCLVQWILQHGYPMNCYRLSTTVLFSPLLQRLNPWLEPMQSGKPAAAPSPRQPRANPSVDPYPTREALASHFTPPVSRCFGYCDSRKSPSSPCPPSVTPKGSPGLCRGRVEATSSGGSSTPKLKRMSLDLCNDCIS